MPTPAITRITSHSHPYFLGLSEGGGSVITKFGTFSCTCCRSRVLGCSRFIIKKPLLLPIETHHHTPFIRQRKKGPILNGSLHSEVGPHLSRALRLIQDTTLCLVY